MSLESSVKRSTAVVAIFGLALWVLVPIASFVFLTFRAQDVAVTEARPVWKSVEKSPDVTTSPVGLALTWEPGTTLVAPQWSGIVQHVSVSPGDVLESGETVARIDRIDRIAYKSRFPFTRSLALGDQGDDVKSLHGLLAKKKIAAPRGEVFTSETQAAVRTLALRLGATDASVAGVFDPSWVIFLPATTTAVEVLFAVGAPAPAAGEPVVTAVDLLVSADLIEPALVESINQQEDFAAANDLSDADKVSPAEGDTLMVGASEIQMDSNGVSDDSLAVLQGAVQSKTHAVLGRLSSSAASGDWVVPSSAIVVDPSGALCLVVRNGDDVYPRSVKVVSDSQGRSLVVADLSELDEVAIAPESPSRKC